ncbi:MAG TPA: MarR family transcriptional regulator [Allosphingosinicella sp.]
MCASMADPSSRLPPYRHSLAGTLLAAREAVMAPVRPYLRDAGVTEQQWRVLRVLSDEGPMEPTGLADAALLHAPSVTRILKELGDRGYTERRRDPSDGRRAIIAIAPAGRNLVDETSARTLRLFEQYRARFGPDRLAALQRELRELTHSIGQDLSPEGATDKDA